MSRHDATTASIEVLTEAEGLLGAAGHDLRLRAGDFEIAVDDGRIEARVVATGVKLVSARRGEADLPTALSSSDRATIDRHLQRDVLEALRFPEIRFLSSRVAVERESVRIEGTLSLHGAERPLAFTARQDGTALVAEFAVDQPAFGIKPFSALFGTLKVKPRVVVRVRVPSNATLTGHS